MEDTDLPLMANTKDILVHHYIFDLFCDFSTKKLSGSSVMFLQSMCSSSHNSEKLLSTACGHYKDQTLASTAAKFSSGSTCDNVKTFKLILDCSDISVKKVEELNYDEYEKCKFTGHCKYNTEKNVQLQFSVEKWCLKIWKPGVGCSCEFPRCIKIDYETQSNGLSLMWVCDQDGKPAVYTYGAWINNRSIFPCQEPPIAMATWEAAIRVAEPAVVLMSGDERAKCSSSNGMCSYYYYTRMKLPLATLALAIGYWNTEDGFDSDNLQVDLRMWATPSLLVKVVSEFSAYICSCVKAAVSILGDYPFPRIDFLVVPRGFASLGMASPNIIFISQSLISGDGSMSCRIAHEISHSWFGLLIGASDWTEEWLSEGFATFMEDVIHAKAMSMTIMQGIEYDDTKANMRSQTLCAEVKNTDAELQVLRPNKKEVPIENVDGVDAAILKNGKNPEKGFMQVHYIKGFFLLKFLSDHVGRTKFLEFLKCYVSKFRGKLVDSLEMIKFFCDSFETECCDLDLTVDEISQEWLYSTKIPKTISSLKMSPANSLNRIAIREAEKWRKLNRSFLTRKNKKRKKIETEDFTSISCEVLPLVLDVMLRKETLSHSVMKLMQQVYDIEEKNAEVRHRWCELVVKHRYYPGYVGLEKFLQDDLAMGVYLYGELILNGTASQKALAERCFHAVQQEMEPNCIHTILKMLEQKFGINDN